MDYLTFSSKIYSTQFFVEKLGLNEVQFSSLPGRHGWSERLYFRGISFFHGGRDDICIELSGVGCRTVEELNGTFDWYQFFLFLQEDIKNQDVHLSRLDIAADDRDGILNFRTLCRCCAHRRYIAKSRFRTWTDGSEQIIYFGAPASDRRLRIYNKAIEQGETGHWIRVELQMRDDTALSFLLNWFNMSGDVGVVFGSVLRDFLRFVTAKVENNHHDRAKVTRWWDQFLGSAVACRQLYLHSRGYSLPSVCAFLEKQAASSLLLWLQANNGNVDDIIKMIEGATLNRRQFLLLQKIQEFGPDVVL